HVARDAGRRRVTQRRELKLVFGSYGGQGDRSERRELMPERQAVTCRRAVQLKSQTRADEHRRFVIIGTQPRLGYADEGLGQGLELDQSAVLTLGARDPGVDLEPRTIAGVTARCVNLEAKPRQRHMPAA